MRRRRDPLRAPPARLPVRKDRARAERGTRRHARRPADTAAASVRAGLDADQRDRTYSAKVTVTLQTPVSGQASAVVNIPDNVSYASGQVISILVDPADPGYAELPGSPYVTDSTTAGLVISAALFGVVGAAGIFRAIGMRRRQHAWRAIRLAAPAR